MSFQADTSKQAPQSVTFPSTNLPPEFLDGFPKRSNADAEQHQGPGNIPQVCLAGNAIRSFDSMLTISIGQKRKQSLEAYFLSPVVSVDRSHRTPRVLDAVDAADVQRRYLGFHTACRRAANISTLRSKRCWCGSRAF
jgi:hypothetical protein